MDPADGALVSAWPNKCLSDLRLHWSLREGVVTSTQRRNFRSAGHTAAKVKALEELVQEVQYEKTNITTQLRLICLTLNSLKNLYFCYTENSCTFFGLDESYGHL